MRICRHRIIFTGLLLLFPLFALSGDKLYILLNEQTQLNRVDNSSLWLDYSEVIQSHPIFRVPLQFSPGRLTRWQEIELAENADKTTVIERLAADARCSMVESPPIRHTCALTPESLPNDPLSVFQWHLEAVDAYAAWDLIPDAAGIVIAVIDIGIDLDHPDLQPVLWTNEAELNGVLGYDDDSNGFTDDVNGYDFYNDDGNPQAALGDSHGSHCAGIAAAAHNNNLGITGLAPEAKIMALRSGQGSSITTGFEAILYAVDNGANILSLSWGGYDSSMLERDIIDYALNQGVIVICAAGNDGVTTPYYPAAYEGTLSIAATNSMGQIWGGSNWGSWVDLAAPGAQIFSTVNDGYGYLSGTSMATPLVAGIAALLLADNPTLTNDALRSRLTSATEPIPGLPIGRLCSGVINAWRAVVADRPTLVLHNAQFDDNNENGVLEAGEEFSVVLHLELIGAEAELVRVELLENVFEDRAICGLESYTWTDAPVGLLVSPPLSARVEPEAARGSHPLAVAIRTDAYRDTLVIKTPVNPPWLSHDAGSAIISITDFGALGYNDYVNACELPDGVRLDDLPIGLLFHGSLMITDDELVSDCAYGSNDMDTYDFHTLPGGEILLETNEPQLQVSSAQFTDDFQPGDHVGILVRQTATSFPEQGNFLLIDYEIQSSSGAPLDLTAGIFCDWDIPPYERNTVGFDVDLRLSYMLGEGSVGDPACGAGGIVALDDDLLAGVRAIDNEIYFYGEGQFTDAVKRQMLTGGLNEATAARPKDWSHLIAIDLGMLAPGSSCHARFAIVAGHDLEELRQAALLAHDAAETRITPRETLSQILPGDFYLSPAYPNPFNSAIQLFLTVPATGEFRIVVFDLLGREVAHISSGVLAAGRHEVYWNGLNEQGFSPASGMYLIQASGMGMVDISKVCLVK